MKISTLFTSLNSVRAISKDNNFTKLLLAAQNLHRKITSSRVSSREDIILLAKMLVVLDAHSKNASVSSTLNLASKFEILVPTLVQVTTTSDDFI